MLLFQNVRASTEQAIITNLTFWMAVYWLFTVLSLIKYTDTTSLKMLKYKKVILKLY